MADDRVAVVICAAGSSSRMGGVKKEYRSFREQGDVNEGLTVLGAAVRAFASVLSVEVIVITVPQNEEATVRKALPPEYLNADKPKIVFVDGGETRQISVFNALSILQAYNPSYVLIHDGARPWISSPLIERIIQTAKQYSAVVPLLPLPETPKECDCDIREWGELNSNVPAGFIKRHLRRANTGGAQTPQGFKFPEILFAHEKAAKVENEEFTDDAEIWGRFCGQVAVIPGDRENRKITFPEDLC